MKKFLCLLICSLWLYSCSGDSNPTGNDFSNMKFESVTIDVRGLRFNYKDENGALRKNVNDCKYTTDTTKSLISMKNGEYVYRYSWTDNMRETKSEEIRFNFNKNMNLIDSMFIDIQNYSNYSYKTDPHTHVNYFYEYLQSLCLLNLPVTIDSNNLMIIDIPTSTFDKHVVSYNSKYGYTGYTNNYTLNEYLGGSETAYIKIVLTPAK